MKPSNSTQKKLDAAMLSINTILREIYTNKSTDEYKMKGDITKSPTYASIEKMTADLAVLRGFSKVDAADLKQLFSTLHRPIFKAMAKEYIMEQNDRNTVFTAMYTIGYRMLVGELSRIFASTEATPKGIVYKPDKVSRKNDASKVIKAFNGDLEKKLDDYIRDIQKHPGSTPVNESFIEMLLESTYTEWREIREVKPFERNLGNGSSNSGFDPNKRIQPKPNNNQNDKEAPVKFDPDKRIQPTQENTTSGGNDSASAGEHDKNVQVEGSGCCESGVCRTETPKTTTEQTDESVQESVVGAVATAIGKAAGGIATAAKGVGALSGIFAAANRIIHGINPLADINYLFMDSYEKKIRQFENVSDMYIETKKAYDEYMRIPEAKRSKKVESKYVQNIEKYNIAMQNLAAEIEHFNQRAQKEAGEKASEMEQKIPSGSTTEGGNPSAPTDDDDMQF